MDLENLEAEYPAVWRLAPKTKLLCQIAPSVSQRQTPVINIRLSSLARFARLSWISAGCCCAVTDTFCLLFRVSAQDGGESGGKECLAGTFLYIFPVSFFPPQGAALGTLPTAGAEHLMWMAGWLAGWLENWLLAVSVATFGLRHSRSNSLSHLWPARSHKFAKRSFCCT